MKIEARKKKLSYSNSLGCLMSLFGTIELGGGTAVSGPPSGLLGKHVFQRDEKLSWQCDSEALSDYRKIIKQYPKYLIPFIYILGYALRKLETLLGKLLRKARLL